MVRASAGRAVSDGAATAAASGAVPAPAAASEQGVLPGQSGQTGCRRRERCCWRAAEPERWRLQSTAPQGMQHTCHPVSSELSCLLCAAHMDVLPATAGHMNPLCDSRHAKHKEGTCLLPAHRLPGCCCGTTQATCSWCLRHLLPGPRRQHCPAPCLAGLEPPAGAQHSRCSCSS